MTNKQLLTNILVKKAKGYSYKERTDEYVVADGEKKLVKSKTVTKRIQPDVNAIKALITMEEAGQDIANMTDEQLEAEKLRLIRLLDMVDSPQTPSDDEE